MLAMVRTLADQLRAEMAELSATNGSPAQWAEFLDAHALVSWTDEAGGKVQGRAPPAQRRDLLGDLSAGRPGHPWAATAYTELCEEVSEVRLDIVATHRPPSGVPTLNP